MNNILEKLKAINIKNVVRSFTLIWGVILIVIMTLVNLGFDQNFNFLNWLSNSLIIFGIIVYGLLMGESWGKDNRKHDQKGLYYKSLNDFEKLLLANSNCFVEWRYLYEGCKKADLDFLEAFMFSVNDCQNEYADFISKNRKP